MKGIGRTLLAAAVVGLALASMFPAPAQACSCAGPVDIVEWVENSEAVFVGTLVDKRSANGGEFGSESIYTFEIEEWVKGDLGKVIEVRSASDGAGCGFEFFGGERIGAVIYQAGDHLEGGLCGQIDPDVLLAAMKGTELSTTGVGRLLVSNDSPSTILSVLDDTGATVVDLSPNLQTQTFSGTSHLEVCPGGELMLQATPHEIVVWNLDDLTVASSYELSGLNTNANVWDISCREPDASSIWIIAGSGDGNAVLMEVAPELKPIIPIPGMVAQIGQTFVVYQMDAESDPTLLNIESGEEILLHETPQDLLQALSVAPHPSNETIAMLETRFSIGGPVESTLFILDATGTAIQQFEIPWESYSPVWLDDDRVIVTAYNFDNWEESFVYVFEVSTGTSTVLNGWNARWTVADGNVLYGVRGGDVLVGNLETGAWDTLVTLPTQSAGPLVLLEAGSTTPPVATTQPVVTAAGPTTPPLVAPELGVETEPVPGLQWLAGIAFAGFFGVLIWLSRSRKSDEVE